LSDRKTHGHLSRILTSFLSNPLFSFNPDNHPQGLFSLRLRHSRVFSMHVSQLECELLLKQALDLRIYPTPLNLGQDKAQQEKDLIPQPGDT
jgi:hypothetical protein